ncbi:MAG: prenyltransferase [Syntrophales bacterium]|nr:prenyltransferase [Syntrophales bacterium]MCK9390599.1 prenyltransferase [Syntrophales bacterium]
MSIWIQALRLHFVPTSIFPALLGSIIAWSRFQEFNLWYFSLVIVGVTVHHIGLNMVDDVYDYLHAVDRLHGEEKNPYTGGSGVLTGGLLTARHVLSAAIICYLVGAVIAIYLTIAVGWPILIFVAIGVFSSVFYTMPPIRYGYRGLGELSLFINFGPVICLGAFYVQTRSTAWEPFMISLVPGFLMWSMIVINEIPDYEEDRQSGKLNLVARVGRKRGVVLYVAGLTCAYGTILLCAYFRLTSFSVLLGLLTVPIAYSSFRILKDNYMDKIKMAPANLATIKVHALTMICLMIGYFAHGVMS